NLFGALVGCILGSQVSFSMSVLAFENLRAEHLLTPRQQGRRESLDHWEAAMAAVLAGKRSPRGRLLAGYRFPSRAASHVRRTLESLNQEEGGLRSLLNEATSSRDVRRRLVDRTYGIGPKQSSLFLRNIGYSSDVAVLDTHVLAFMRLMGLCDEVRSPSSLRQYERIEDRLAAFALGRGIGLDRLDVSVWIVMRAAEASRATNVS
ncbi:MAG: hypothetical protein WCG85_09135, partial [Polyangia bacterium]